MNILFARMLRVIKLDSSLFEEIIDDSTSQSQYAWVVAILAMATGFGMFSQAGATAVNICLVTTFLSWYFWAFSVYFIGTYMFREVESKTDRKTIMRVMGFANAPGALRLLGVVPQTAPVVFLVTTIWMIAASVTGVKQAMHIRENSKVVVLCAGTWLLSFLVQVLLLILFFSVFGVS